MVMPMSERPSQQSAAIGQRALDSFSLADEADAIADANARTSDLDEKP